MGKSGCAQVRKAEEEDEEERMCGCRVAKRSHSSRRSDVGCLASLCTRHRSGNSVQLCTSLPLPADEAIKPLRVMPTGRKTQICWGKIRERIIRFK